MKWGMPWPGGELAQRCEDAGAVGFCSGEFADTSAYVTATEMARSIKKGPYVVDSLVRKIETLNRSGEKRVLKTWARRCTVLPEFVGHTLAVHNVELYPGRRSRIARSAGAFCQLMAKEGEYAQLRLPSGEVRKFHVNCRAVIGQVGNLEHENVSLGKAGRSRWLGRAPSVRGVAMNPVDHPMGGGEGKTSGGRHPCSPWGKITKGLKTRRRKLSDSLIVRRRKK